MTWKPVILKDWSTTLSTKGVPDCGGRGRRNSYECASALMQHPPASRPELAVMPLGTANDFATPAKFPSIWKHALTLAQAGKSVPVDCVKANNRYFINVASGGFGAKVTAETPRP
ncbi:diacylglycerol kinase family protein [Grimontia hollisae]|uniref:diacylglycerol kinase family protein n=1 Tax=Grimontia hollisae TaxID=673 RepID=UPI00165DCB8B|nr:diacylglycerol kinase family protein [Grimontia hollisae]